MTRFSSSARSDLAHTEQCAQIAKGMARNCAKRIGTSYSFVQTLVNIMEWNDRCKKCKGTKTVKEKTRQEIYIERGMADRQRIVLAGAGDEEVRPVHLLLVTSFDIHISRVFLQVT